VQNQRCSCERCVNELATAYLCLGANLGEREANLRRALALLSPRVTLEEVSSIYETEPVGYKEQPLFLNLACRITTNLPPEKLLCLAKDIETKMGRVPSGQINSPRPIDIDILFYNNKIMETRDLTIPHPRLEDRAFALIPLAEIAPELVHPKLSKSVAQLANDVKGQKGVRKWYHMKWHTHMRTEEDTKNRRLAMGTKGRKNVKKPKQNKEKKK
jgi:2-amino-4-hydroxy-6-hydroxymethyldihydropteridine diphosphokinase